MTTSPQKASKKSKRKRTKLKKAPLTQPTSKTLTRKHWLIISILLVCLSLGLFAANPLYQFIVTRQVSTNLKEVPLNKLTKVTVDLNEKAVIDLGNEEVYIGKIAIPAVKLSLPIVKGSGEDNLFRGAATNISNQKLGQGNYPLSSHKMPYDDHLLFSPLLKVKKDDMLYLTDGSVVYHYRVYDIFVVTPDQIEILDEVPDKTIVTLYTCETDAGTKRHVVRGILTTSNPVAETDPNIIAAFN